MSTSRHCLPCTGVTQLHSGRCRYSQHRQTLRRLDAGATRQAQAGRAVHPGISPLIRPRVHVFLLIPTRTRTKVMSKVAAQVRLTRLGVPVSQGRLAKCWL